MWAREKQLFVSLKKPSINSFPLTLSVTLYVYMCVCDLPFVLWAGYLVWWSASRSQHGHYSNSIYSKEIITWLINRVLLHWRKHVMLSCTEPWWRELLRTRTCSSFQKIWMTFILFFPIIFHVFHFRTKFCSDQIWDFTTLDLATTDHNRFILSWKIVFVVS